MTSSLGALAPASSIIGTSSSSIPNWVADAMTAIQNQQSEGGLLGMLDNAASGNGSISSFLNQSSTTDGFFAMGSGPMRAVYAREDLFAKLDLERVAIQVGRRGGRRGPAFQTRRFPARPLG